MSLLVVSGVSRHFGGVHAVEGVDFAVEAGQIFSVIGPNGAGKTTLFNCLSGLFPASSGSIRFEGHEVSRMPAHRITSLGMARTFQNIRLFGEMTVLENVMVGRHCRTRAGVFGALLRSRRVCGEEARSASVARDLLGFVGLGGVLGADARSLPYGHQRRLEVARALATDPRLILLDEPAAGMNPQETVLLMDLIRRVRDRGVTVLLIEHHMSVVMGISDRIVVLDHGEKIAEGNPGEIQGDPRVVEAYLGKEEIR